MSFDLQPLNVLVEIFHHLPFKDRVLLGGVNRSFRNASEESINRMKSLDITDYLLVYSVTHQSFSSILESSASTLQSIDAKNSFNKLLLKIMADFTYPNLERLEISVTNSAQTKKLISNCPNLRSISLHLSRGLDWPENIFFEKLENLEIHCPRESQQVFYVNLFQTIGPLIGKVPNLKSLTIKSGFRRHFILNVQDINQFLASTPNLEKLYLHGDWDNSPNRPYVDMHRFTDFIPTWRLPKLTTLVIDLGLEHQIPSCTLRCFSISFPRIYLRELQVCTAMTKSQLIDLITNIPSITILKIGSISDARSTKAFVEFVTSTAAIFRRKLEIRMNQMIFDVLRSSEFEQMISRLEKIKNTGGPLVDVKRHGYTIRIDVYSIRYMSMDG